MKKLILLLLICAPVACSAFHLPMPQYEIVSDAVNESVPRGTCIIQGLAATDGIPLSGGLISTLDFKKQTVSDSLGRFELILSENDSSIFFFQSGYEEIVINNYDFKSGHLVTINFTAIMSLINTDVSKPVIYCYSDEPIEASIFLDPRSELTFTYPKLVDNTWDFSVSKNGILHNNQAYPYLFWEGKTHVLTYKSNEIGQLEGYLIKTDTVVAFLENKLNNFGLNQTEKTDFITFWGPRMIQEDYALVQFITDMDYEKLIAGIEVEPTPDAMFRLFMMFTSLENAYTNFEIIEPEITSFPRSGFTVLEWGGAEIQADISVSKLLNR